jgi:hypothetical protein
MGTCTCPLNNPPRVPAESGWNTNIRVASAGDVHTDGKISCQVLHTSEPAVGNCTNWRTKLVHLVKISEDELAEKRKDT